MSTSTTAPAWPWTATIANALHVAADLVGLERALLRAVCWIESRGNPHAVSPAGAQGLLQLMPTTASDLGVVNPFDPMDNARGGARYLAGLIAQFGDVSKALMAYNWGPGNVQRKPDAIPASVRKYAADVLARADVERALSPPLAPAPAPSSAGARLPSLQCPHCGWRFAVGGNDGS